MTSHTIHKAFDERQNYTSPERRLYLAVIVKAIEDACGWNTTSQAEADRADALKWFHEAGPDFDEVCLHAGLDPETTRKAALAFIAEHQGNKRPSQFRAHNGVRNVNTNPLGHGNIAQRAGCSPSAVQQFRKYGKGAPKLAQRIHAAIAAIEAETGRKLETIQ